jgi:hypothetical protein
MGGFMGAFKGVAAYWIKGRDSMDDGWMPVLGWALHNTFSPGGHFAATYRRGSGAIDTLRETGYGNNLTLLLSSIAPCNAL